MHQLERAGASSIWELRAAWMTGHWVAIRMTREPGRLEGYVQEVAASGAYVILDPRDGGESWHIPREQILATFKPHFEEGGERRGPREAKSFVGMEGQLGLVAPLDVSSRAVATMLRAAAMLMPEDVLLTLQALDRVPRRATVALVAEQLGRSEAWARKRLRVLEGQALVARHRRARKSDLWKIP